MSAGAGFICKIHKGESVSSKGVYFREITVHTGFHRPCFFFGLFVSLLPPFCSGALH